MMRVMTMLHDIQLFPEIHGIAHSEKDLLTIFKRVIDCCENKEKNQCLCVLGKHSKRDIRLSIWKNFLGTVQH